MFPCIGQIVAPRKDEPDHDTSASCHVCGKVLTATHPNLGKGAALCCTCQDRLMRSTPNLAQ